MDDLAAEIAEVKLQSIQVHQLCLDKAGVAARLAELRSEPIVPLSISYPATMQLIQAFPSKYTVSTPFFPATVCKANNHSTRGTTSLAKQHWRVSSVPSLQKYWSGYTSSSNGERLASLHHSMVLNPILAVLVHLVSASKVSVLAGGPMSRRGTLITSSQLAQRSSRGS
jgi:hypothetical protein